MSDKVLTLTIGSHFFKLTSISARVRKVVLEFARGYIKYGIETTRRNESQRVALAVYGAATRDREEFRFHINQLDDFLLCLRKDYVTDEMIEVVRLDIPSFSKVNFKVKSHWVPREEQIPIVEYLVADNDNRSRFIGLQTGKGKAQSLDSKIKIPGGWTTMGQIKLDDTVIAYDGKPTKVTGVYPQGELQLYKVTFADGRYVECCAEHLWKVYYVNTSVSKRWRIVNTLEMIRLISMPNPRVYIPLPEPEDQEDAVLPLDPYLLGALLGDGSMTTGVPVITTPDTFIIDELGKVLPENTQINKINTTVDKCPSYSFTKIVGKVNFITESLINLGLFGKRSYEKKIPDIYLLNTSIKQRLALLQGLMDTDGTITEVKSSSYSTSSYDLALNVQYLVRSLGGIASITSRIPTFTYKGEKKNGRMAYEVNIRMKKPSDLFRLPKKKNRTDDNGQYCASLKLRVISIQLSRVAPAQCISIDHPERLYVTNDFIVTHNTLVSLLAAAKLNIKTAIIVRPMYIHKWTQDLQKYYDIPLERIMTVQGLAQLQAILMMGESNMLEDIDAIIISNKTLQLYIKLYEIHRHTLLDLGYVCTPENLFQTLSVGIRLIDEVHQDFHLNFKLDLYTNVFRSFSLSATLINKDPFMNKVYEIAYPSIHRFKVPDLDKYIDSFSLHYRFRNMDKIKTSERFSTSYSHNAFELSLIKHKDKSILQNYFKLIKFTMQCSYTHDRKPGERLIIFCYRTDFCQMVVDYLKKEFPQLDIRRYTSGDPDENMYEPDVRVTTLGSGSTAHDIELLKTAILTVAVDSVQSNVQALGRLRKQPHFTPRFYYFVCDDVKKHRHYHESKEMMLKERAKTFKAFQAPFVI